MGFGGGLSATKVSLRWLMNIGVGVQRVITHRDLALVRGLGGHLKEENPVFFRSVRHRDFEHGLDIFDALTQAETDLLEPQPDFKLLRGKPPPEPIKVDRCIRPCGFQRSELHPLKRKNHMRNHP